MTKNAFDKIAAGLNEAIAMSTDPANAPAAQVPTREEIPADLRFSTGDGRPVNMGLIRAMRVLPHIAVEVRELLVKLANEVDDLRPTLARLEQERDEARELCARLRLEAQIHAGEARCHKSSLHEAYQACTSATGEPGNWNGANPIKAALAAAEAEGMRKAAGIAAAAIAEAPKPNGSGDALNTHLTAARSGFLDACKHIHAAILAVIPK